MRKTVEQYLPLVRYLGTVLGKCYEIVLIELKEQGSGIVAIENAHISGRKVGDGLTDLLLQFIKDETYRTNDFQANYTGICNGKTLRGSTYFIKEGDMLVGMLCVNCDSTSIVELGMKIFEFANLQPMTSIAPLITNPVGVGNKVETVLGTVTELCEKVVRQYWEESGRSTGKLTQNDKLQIIERLNQLGVFLIKGIVPDVARLLGASQASVYRYLSKITND